MEQLSKQNEQIISLLKEIKGSLDDSGGSNLQGAINVEDVAELTGLSKDKVYTLIRQGEIEYIPIGERRKIVPRRALKEWMEKETTKATEKESGLEEIKAIG